MTGDHDRKVEQLDCDRYATFTQTLLYTDTANAPINLTNYTARMQIRDIPGGTILLTLTDGFGITLGGITGLVTLRIEKADTSIFEPGDYKYDLLLTSPNPNSTALRVMEGTFKVYPGITQPAP